MRILVLTDRFVPEIAAPSFRVMEHARIWLQEGHEVTVVTCAPNFPHGELFQGYRNRLYQEEWIEGIRVVRVWSFMSPNAGFFRRIADNASFMCTATLLCCRYPEFDIILATSPPLFVAVAGFLVALVRRRPWVFEIRDLWPASLKAVGAANQRLVTLLEWLELFLYRQANRIIALTSPFKENLTARGIPSAKIDVITNGVDTLLFDFKKRTGTVRETLGFDNRTFLAGYLGTVGMAHGLETIVEAAALCRDDPRIKFLIIGEGARRGMLEEMAKSRRIPNLEFRDFVPRYKVPEYLAALDVAIVHLKPDPLFESVLPSKLFECIAMGTPILCAVPGESTTIVEESGTGVCIPSGDPDAMAKAVMHFANRPDDLEAIRRRGPEAVRRWYSRRVKALDVLTSLEAAL